MITGLTFEQWAEYILQYLEANKITHEYDSELLAWYLQEQSLSKVDQELTLEQRAELMVLVLTKPEGVEWYLSRVVKNRYTILEDVLNEFLVQEAMAQAEIVI